LSCHSFRSYPETLVSHKPDLHLCPRAPQEVQEETQEFLAQMQRKEEEAEAKAQQLAETKRHLQELVERLQAAIIEEELSGPHVRMPASRDVAPFAREPNSRMEGRVLGG